MGKQAEPREVGCVRSGRGPDLLGLWIQLLVHSCDFDPDLLTGSR